MTVRQMLVRYNHHVFSRALVCRFVRALEQTQFAKLDYSWYGLTMCVAVMKWIPTYQVLKY